MNLACKEIEKYTYQKTEEFIRLLFSDTFEEQAKEKSSKEHDNVVIFSEHLAWSILGFVTEPGTKKIDIENCFGVRTYKSFLHHAMDDRAVFFTPNTFCSRKFYKKDLEHLRWINALVVDVDEDMSFDEALIKIKRIGLPPPTAINKTPRGLHIYWFLKKRIPGWHKTNKELYEKLVSAIQVSLSADPFAKSASNFYRIPKNIHYFDENNRFTILKFKNWYKKLDDSVKIKLKEGEEKENLFEKEAIKKLMEGVENGNRNLAAFSVAKIYKYMGSSLEETITRMEEWNKKNLPPLPPKELIKRIKSAFKKGDEIVPVKIIREITGVDLYIGNIKVFRKNKKERSNRTNSHKEEIIDDLFFYLKKIGGIYEGSQKNLALDMTSKGEHKISERSLKEVLKELKNEAYGEKISIEVIGIGRGAMTIITLKEGDDNKKDKSNSEESCNTNVLQIEKFLKQKSKIVNQKGGGDSVEISTIYDKFRKEKKRCKMPITIKVDGGHGLNVRRTPSNRISTFSASPQDNSS